VTFEKVPDFGISSFSLFSSCGQNGKTGPTKAMCDDYYTAMRDPQGWYQSVINGVQRLVVPETGYYRFTANGGKGGDGQRLDFRHRGGLGASVTGTFYLEKGEALNLVVGQGGWLRPSWSTTGSIGGGGGGGTFLWREKDCKLGGECMPMLVAGGGGGASYSDAADGALGQAHEAGTAAVLYGGDGGTGGEGGSMPFQDSAGVGGGGSGWRSAGKCFYNYVARCGKSRRDNFVGGDASTSDYCEGGFGGGAGTQHEGAGGGGYSG
jgi:hypothetical protein